MDPSAILSQLRDLHMPASVSAGQPLSLLVTVLGFIILLSLIGLYYWRRRRCSTALEEALQILAEIELKQKENQSYNGLADLSILMRRVALSRFSRKAVACLHGEAWLDFLNKTGNTAVFIQSPGSYLAEGPYCSSIDLDWEALFFCVKKWMKKVCV
ncbi:MAG: uncharacterized protein K0R12_454 [Gammaproteobacteria bacterium]|nr:uncharacterized protein [Gammaproteobacteria bacterium]